MFIEEKIASITKDLVTIKAQQAEILQVLRGTAPPSTTPADAAPIMSAKQVKEMTDWPDGTLYAKVATMPEGVVIRGRSKRLLFDRAKFLQWLQTPVKP